MSANKETIVEVICSFALFIIALFLVHISGCDINP